MTTFLRSSVGTIYSAIFGIILGLISWIFLFLVYLGIHLFWDGFILKENSKLLILTVCLIGGLLVGLCEKYIGKYPKTMEDVIKEFKTTGSIEYKSLPKSIVKIFTILWFGATVGPEAGLTGIIGGTSTLISEFLKFGFKRKRHNKVQTNSTVEKIFEIPLYGLYNFTDENDKKKVKAIKRLLYGTIILFSVITLFTLMSLDKKVSFITKFSPSIITKEDFIFLIPLFIIGLLIVFYSNILDKIVFKIFKPLQKYKILHSIIGGLILGLLAITIPFVLFSGEHTLKELIIRNSSLGIALLILIGLIKLLSLKICVNTGWIGGPIFPIMFSSAAIGMACSYIFNISLPFSVAVVMATALAGIAKNFKLTVILIIWFFSINTWPFILVVAFASEFITKKYLVPLFSRINKYPSI
ncbi:chloride channel protein [Clostridium massiliamazoniense]|uniref:chloride channel protein n=1 Tax=Clostridium massiliamazoniense TaxID=1347366 RepID=UPI0006D7DA0B|nr:chloride channel protein [Clostridium massiliamazoniense]